MAKKKSKVKAKPKKRKAVKRVRDYTGRFVTKGTKVKRKYYRPYEPSKKSNYSKFRHSLSKYIKDNDIKLGQLDERTALQNYNELASSVWRENKGISLNITIKEIPLYVSDYTERKRKVKHKKPVIPEYFQDPRIYFDIQWIIWGDTPKHPYFVLSSYSIMPKGVTVNLDGSDYTDSESGDFELKPDVYDKAFKHWVDWCNDYHRQKDIINESDRIEIYYAFAEDCVWNDKKKRWELEIFSCRRIWDEKKNKYVAVFDDFGYTPPYYEVKPEVVKPPEKPVEIVKEAVPEKDIDKEIKKIEKELELTNKKIELLNKVDALMKQGWTKKEILKLLGNV